MRWEHGIIISYQMLIMGHLTDGWMATMFILGALIGFIVSAAMLFVGDE